MPASPLFVILIVLFFFSAFFSASEAALIAINKVRLRHMVEKKRPGARRLYGLISRLDKLIATILVGNNLVNTAIASISTILFTRYLGGQESAIVVATLVTTIVLVIFGELTPKVLATNHPEGTAFLFRHLIDFFIRFLSPVTYLLTIASGAVIRLFGGNPHHRSPLITEEELKMMITIGKEEGFYGDNERRMLERIFHFDEVLVGDVMTTLDNVVSVPVDIDPEELERVLLEEGHNRIPVHQGTRDNIVGILYVRDLLYLFKNSSLIRVQDLTSVPYFVPPKKRVTELLKEFQARKIQIAIVKDPASQKAIGLVTLEDLLEEIVGEIEEIDSTLQKD
jgi:putative hemolysin